MLSPELKNTIDNIKNPIYLISSENQIIYSNPAAKTFTAGAEHGSFFFEKLCGRRVPCTHCPVNGDCSETVSVPSEALCSFANVAFRKVMFEDEKYLVSEWRIDSSENSYVDSIQLNDGSEEKIIDFSNINELNIASALENSGGDKSVYQSVLKAYLNEGLKKVWTIKDFYEKKEYTDLRIEVHGVKGTSYAVGADHLGNYAKKLEFACRAIESDEDHNKTEASLLLVDNNIYDFLDEYNNLLLKLSKAFGIDSDCFSSNDTSNLISNEEFIEILQSENVSFDDYNKPLFKNVLTALDEYDVDVAVDQLKFIQQSEYNINKDEAYVIELSTRCIELLNAFDYSGAAELINPFIS